MSNITTKSLRASLRALRDRRKKVALDANIGERFGFSNPVNVEAIKERDAIDLAIQEIEEELKSRGGKR